MTVTQVRKGEWRWDRLAEQIDWLLMAGMWWFWAGVMTIVLWLVGSITTAVTHLTNRELNTFVVVEGLNGLTLLGVFVFLVLSAVADFRNYGGVVAEDLIQLTALVLAALLVTAGAVFLAVFVDPAPRWILWTPIVQMILALASSDVRELLFGRVGDW